MARGETVAELPTFKEAFKHRRCLVLVHGFYDSQDMGPYLQPWHFHLKGDALMCFAALWEPSAAANCFTIVSAPANDLMRRVIDRMPVILPQALWKPWMDSSTGQEDLQAMLKTLPSEQMEAWQVTRKVNTKGFDGPECIARLPEEQNELF